MEVGTHIVILFGFAMTLIFVGIGLVSYFFNSVQGALDRLANSNNFKNDNIEQSVDSNLGDLIIQYGSYIAIFIGIIAAITTITRQIIKYKKRNKIEKQMVWNRKFMPILDLPSNKVVDKLKNEIKVALRKYDYKQLEYYEAEYLNELAALHKCNELKETSSPEKRNEVIGLVVSNLTNKLTLESNKDDGLLNVEIEVLEIEKRGNLNVSKEEVKSEYYNKRAYNQLDYIDSGFSNYFSALNKDNKLKDTFNIENRKETIENE